MRKPYSIIAPPYDVTSGGIRVMYALRSWLEIKGEIVYMNAKMETDFIAVYPEIYHGNEANAGTVVRYILNKPGVMASYGEPGPSVFPINDKLFYFSRLFAPSDTPDEQIMFLPVLNLQIFKDTGSKHRKNSCVLVGKGQETEEFTKTMFHLTREFALDQQKLAEYLNTCDVMYSYDQVSAMFEIARLCGVKVVVIPSGQYSRRDLEKYEPGVEGITYGLGNTNKTFNSSEFREKYLGLRDLFSRKIDRFIEMTQ